MTAEVLTAQPPNNTNIGGCFRARGFLLTLNEVSKYNDLKDAILKLKSCDYFLSAKEIAPTTGHEHIHIYIHFESSYKLSKKIMSFGAHVDIQKYNSPKQIINYVKKDGEIIDEIGEAPKQGTTTCEDLKQIDISECPPQYLKTKLLYESITSTDIDVEDLKKDVKVYYIQGPSGIGKTETMKQIIRDNKEIYGTKLNMIKYENGFYLGVNPSGNAKICVYDDFRDNHMKASEFINFIDYNKHFMNIKGGSRLNDYSLIIITSIQRLNNIYSNVQEEQKQQWIRRINLIDLYKKNEEDNYFKDLDLSDL